MKSGRRELWSVCMKYEDREPGDGECMQWRWIESSTGAPSKWPKERPGDGTRSWRNLSTSVDGMCK